MMPLDQPEPRFQRPGWLERHERYAARAATGLIDLLFLGDSITQRWEKAPEVWERYYGSRRAVAMGIDNDGTRQLLWRLDNCNWAGVSPRLVVLLIGTNNIGADGAGPDELETGIAAIIAKVRALFPGTVILLLGILPYDYNGLGRMETIRQANIRLATLTDGVRIHFLDMGSLFLKPDGSVDRTLLHDGAHPSTLGYEVWAEAIEPLVRRFVDGRIS